MPTRELLDDGPLWTPSAIRSWNVTITGTSFISFSIFFALIFLFSTKQIVILAIRLEQIESIVWYKRNDKNPVHFQS